MRRPGPFAAAKELVIQDAIRNPCSTSKWILAFARTTAQPLRRRIGSVHHRRDEPGAALIVDLLRLVPGDTDVLVFGICLDTRDEGIQKLRRLVHAYQAVFNHDSGSSRYGFR